MGTVQAEEVEKHWKRFLLMRAKDKCSPPGFPLGWKKITMGFATQKVHFLDTRTPFGESGKTPGAGQSTIVFGGECMPSKSIAA